MKKTILITGSTDGIGFLTAKKLIEKGHNVIIHGRNFEKVQNVKSELSKQFNKGTLESFVADLSNFDEVIKLANEVKLRYPRLDVLINNAGVYKTKDIKTSNGLDVRFAVNTLAPYLLTKNLIPLFGKGSRVVNLSSAAQARVDINAISKFVQMSDSEIYAQSKLALTMWSTLLGLEFKTTGPMIVSVNPKSFLGSKMVKDAYGILGEDINIGANILCEASLSKEFDNAHGKYFDNDKEEFSLPHHDALDLEKCKTLVYEIEKTLSNKYLQ